MRVARIPSRQPGLTLPLPMQGTERHPAEGMDTGKPEEFLPSVQHQGLCPQPVCTNKVLSGHSHTLFTVTHGYFHAAKAKVSSCGKLTRKALYSSVLALPEHKEEGRRHGAFGVRLQWPRSPPTQARVSRPAPGIERCFGEEAETCGTPRAPTSSWLCVSGWAASPPELSILPYVVT